MEYRKGQYRMLAFTFYNYMYLKTTRDLHIYVKYSVLDFAQLRHLLLFNKSRNGENETMTRKLFHTLFLTC